jgi:hypothetical protein
MKKYNIPPIVNYNYNYVNYIEDHCMRIFKRITDNTNHQFIQKIEKFCHSINTIASKKLAPARSNTKRYQNSFLQSCLKINRIEFADKYTNPRRKKATKIKYRYSRTPQNKTNKKKVHRQSNDRKQHRRCNMQIMHAQINLT